MYYAIYLDEYLKTKDYFEYKEVGRAGFAVIIKQDSEPQTEYVELTEDEALAFMFVDIADDYPKLSFRESEEPGNSVWHVLKDRPKEKVPQTNKLGDVLEGLFKYKYTITEIDRKNAALLREKIAKWIPNYEQ
jgi:hypothetical protein